MDVYLTDQQEKVLKHILSLKRNKDNSVHMGLQMEGTCPASISEKELITELNALEQAKLITIKWGDIHHSNLNYANTIFITDKGSKYFIDKNLEKKNIKWEKKKFYIPLIFSILSLILSIISILLNDNVFPFIQKIIMSILK